MNSELLLEWFTHLGSGRWGAFRDAVAELYGVDGQSEVADLCRSLRIALSDLGHVEFFVAQSRRWRVFKPAFASLAAREAALLTGGRTRRLLQDVEELCATERIAVERTVMSDAGLTQVVVVGSSERTRKLAGRLGIEYLPDAGQLAASLAAPVQLRLATALACAEPINWTVRSWSFEVMNWVERRLSKTAREYTNRHGVRRFMVHTGGSELREMEKREAVFAASVLRRVRLASYDLQARSISVPLAAPLPEQYARAACLASGRLARVDDGRLWFDRVPPDVASMLLVSLGQGYPMRFAQLTGAGS